MGPFAAKADHRLWATIAFSAALHGALLWSLPSAGTAQRGQDAMASLTVWLGSVAARSQMESQRAAEAVASARAPEEQPQRGGLTGHQEGTAQLALPTAAPDSGQPTRYYLPSEIDQGARLVKAPDLRISTPVEQRTVVAKVLINEHGTVDSVQVEHTLRGSILGESVISALEKARFTPGMLAGSPVKSQLLFEVDYRQPEPKMLEAPRSQPAG